MGQNPFFAKIWEMFTANLGTKVISVVIAIVLWFIVLDSRNIEVVKDIPLEVVTPADIVTSNEVPDKIAFRLSGPKAFLRAVLDRHEEPIRVNLSGAKPGLVTYRFFSDSIRVPIGVKVLSINPTAILLKLEYLKRREVPVKVITQGTPPDGYRVVKVEAKPEVVRIKGAESHVDSVSEIETLPIDVTNMRQPIDREAPLDLTRYNVQLDGNPPAVTVDIEPISANFRIKNVDIRVLSSYKIRLEQKTVNILVRASARELRTLDRSQVQAVVDLTGKPKGKYRARVKVKLPAEIGLVKVVPDRVNVTLY